MSDTTLNGDATITPSARADAAESRVRLTTARTQMIIDRERRARIKSSTEMSKRAEAVAVEYMAGRAHKAIGGGRLRTNNILSFGRGDSALLAADRLDLMESAQHLERANPIIRGMINRRVSIMIGRGLRPMPATADKAWNQAAESIFSDWASSKMKCDHTHVRDWFSLQRLWARRRVVDGEIAAIRTSDGSIQTIEAGQIGTPNGIRDGVFDETRGHITTDGVAISKDGRVVGWYVLSYMDFNSPGLKPASERLAVRDAIDVYALLDRASGHRGMTELASVIVKAEQLDNWFDAAIVAAEIHAMLAFVWKTNNPGGSARLLATGSETNDSGGTDRTQRLDPGTILHAGLQDSIESVESKTPNPQMAGFMREVIRMIGSPLNMPIELAFLDFSEGNFSQARAALRLLEEQVKAERDEFISCMLRPQYEWVLARAINSGRLAPRGDWKKAEWPSAGFGALDPLKDALAAKIMVETNQKSLAEVITERGGRPGAVFDAREVEMADQIRRGIAPVADAGSGGATRSSDAASQVGAGNPSRSEQDRAAASAAINELIYALADEESKP